MPYLDEPAAHVVARLLADVRIRTMLREAWDSPPRDEPLLAEALLKRLTQRPDLAGMILATPALANSLTARPMTFYDLAGHQQAIDVLGSVLDDIARRGPLAVAEEAPPPVQATPLDAGQLRLSSSFAHAGERAVQPGFDIARKNDRGYRSAFLDELYVQSVGAQEEVSDLAEKLAGSARSGARTEPRSQPKDRRRAEDKVIKYRGNVALLTDLAAAKVPFRSVSDVYTALDAIGGNSAFDVVEFDDRFVNPQASGYRDLQLMLRTSSGHVAEFRLQLAALDEVASWEHAATVGRDRRVGAG
ncbi:nucleotidyltransferase family protein [Micromonospora carbonacea]|uniref:hypothetical protein n=1 Tax=Micromonospora carbonacea TaxID=47853 RepID=UPI003712AB96